MPTIHIPHTQLQRHPRNMRLTYHLADVRRMGLSQIARVRRGLDPCIQPLIITLGPGQNYDPHRHARATFTIVAGHLRHAGNAWLKQSAPPLNCLVRNYADESAMLAEMRAENGMRADISPIGWARHYQASLAEDKSLTIQRLARESGKSLHFVQSRLDLLRLSPVAQELIDRGDLPLGAAQPLLELDDQAIQAKAAKSLAHRHASVKTIEKQVAALLTAQTAQRKKPTRSTPTRPAVDGLPASLPKSADSLSAFRTQTAAACAKCDIGHSLPLAEPAWHFALKAAGETCACCGLQSLKGACGGCPLSEVMTAVVRAARREQAHS